MPFTTGEVDREEELAHTREKRVPKWLAVLLLVLLGLAICLAGYFTLQFMG